MIEHVSDERLALYAGGDTTEREASAISQHLRSCEECRSAMAAFENVRDLLACSYGEPEPSDLCEIRQRIARETERAAGGNRWAWLLAGTAAAALVLISLAGIRQQRPASKTPVPAIQLIAPPIMPAPPLVEIPTLRNIARRTVRKREAAIRSVALITRANEPSLIRMTTADPNVVILWESNNEEENE